MGLDNTCFMHVSPGEPLPFPDGSFDGITAASSIEQTPDPRATLRELHRVLKVGGRLYLSYESLNYYRGGKEHGLSLWQMEEQCTSMLLYDRRVDQEHVVQYRVALTLPEDRVRALFRQHDCPVTFAGLSEPVLAELIRYAADAQVCTATHASYGTLVRWLGEMGFGSIQPVADPRCFLSSLFGALPADQRPVTKEATNAYLRPIMQALLHMPCSPAMGPGRWDPPIVAVKE
jgi:SAM-dependent methyltransferase